MQLLFLISIIISYVITIILGFFTSYNYKQHIPVYAWIIIIALTIFFYFIGQNTRIISIFNFTINLNWCLQGFGLGIIAGLVFHTLRTN